MFLVIPYELPEKIPIWIIMAKRLGSDYDDSPKNNSSMITNNQRTSGTFDLFCLHTYRRKRMVI